MAIDNLRSARSEVLNASERDRGKFTVNPDHWPYKVYQWWLREKNPRRIPQLNFCHFWRAVLLWAPGRAIGKVVGPVWDAIPLKSTLLTILCLVATVGIVFEVIKHPIILLVGGVSVILAILYVAATCILARYLWLRFEHKLRDSDYADIGDIRKALLWTYFGLCGLPALVACGVVFALRKALLGTVTTLVWLFDTVEVHRLIGGAIIGIFQALDWHPKRLWWLRPWLVLMVASWTVFLIQQLLATGIDWWYLAIAIGLTFLATAFSIAIATATMWAYWRRKNRAQRRALLETPGFVDWLWTSDEARNFRNDVSRYYKFDYRASFDEMVRELWLSDIRFWLTKFNLAGKLPEAQFKLLPVDVQRKITPNPNRWRRTKAFWAGTVLIVKGTWAFICLIWSYLVYAKRVGACPMVVVKGADAPVTADEPTAA